LSKPSTILDYDDDALLAFVDRRVGGQNYSPIWDINEPIDLFKVKAKQRGKMPSAFKGGQGAGSSNQRRLRTAITSKYGQAVVKVISYGRGKESARNQLNYISRRGDLELEGRDGTVVEGSEAVEELAKDWARDFDNKANSRNLVHIVLSTPKGTSRTAAHESVRDFARNVFADNYDYMLVRHDDTDNPHSHLLVKMRGDDGIKLDPRKADLKAWREEYARCASRHGIKLDASSRLSRGQGKRGKKMAVVKMKARGEMSYAEKATAHEVIKIPDTAHPAEIAAYEAFEKERREFAKLGLALKELSCRDDETGKRARALLERVHSYATSISPPEGMRAEFRAIIHQGSVQNVQELISRAGEGLVEPSSKENLSTSAKVPDKNIER